jgi:hypothetical protein
MRTQVTLAGALALAATSIFLVFQQSSKRTRLEREAVGARTTIERLRKEIDELSKTQLSGSDLGRLRADQREAIRLRGEVMSLKQALAAAEQGANETRAAKSSDPQSDPATALRTSPLPEDNPEVRVHKTTLISAQLPSGHSLLVGGWESQPGKRTFALIDPKRDPQGADVITVATRWVELSDEAAKRLRLGTYLDTSGEQSATLAQFSAEEFAKIFENEAGVDLLTAPKVSTISGRQARISVTDSRETAAGPVDFGSQLDILPNLSEDGKINVTLRASMVLPREP